MDKDKSYFPEWEKLYGTPESDSPNNTMNQLLQNLYGTQGGGNLDTQKKRLDIQKKVLDIQTGQYDYYKKRKDDLETTTENSIDALISTIKNSTTGNQIMQNNASIDAIAPSAYNNPEAIFKLQQAKNENDEKSSQYLNYKNQIISASRKVQDIDNYTDEDWQKMTVDDITDELINVNGFTDSMYGNPLEKKDPLKFIGRFNPGGGNTDINVINKMQHYEKQLQAALSALEDNGMINEHELFYIYAGEKDKLDTARKENIADAESNLRSINSSINSIKKYQKMLTNSIVKKGYDPNAKFDWGIIGDTDVAIEALMLDLKNKPGLYEDMTEGEYKEQKLAEIEVQDMSIQDVIKMWQDEIDAYETMYSLEHQRFYKWAGREYSVKGSLELKKHAEIEKKLEQSLGKDIKGKFKPLEQPKTNIRY